MFESEAREGLFAFAGEPSGSHLPEQHGPWRSSEAAGQKSPKLSRIDQAAIEQAVKKVGFQLWRKRPTPKLAGAKSAGAKKPAADKDA